MTTIRTGLQSPSTDLAHAVDAVQSRQPSISPIASRAAELLGWFFAGAGVLRLLPVPFDVAMFAGWGLPGWFRSSVGIAELAVGILALRASTRPVGLIGIGVVMVSAGTVHAVLGHSLLLAALLNGTLAAVAFATAWAHRAEVR